MKLKILSSMALFAGLLCMGVAQAQTFSPPWNDPMVGYMVVYEGGPPALGGVVVWENGTSTNVTGQYDLDELGTYTSDFLTFDFRPETNKFVLNQPYGGATNYYRNAGETDGTKFLECLTFWERTIIGTESNVVLEFTINSNDLDTDRYEIFAFIKHVVPGTGASSAITNLNITGLTSGSYTIEIAQNYAVWTDDFIQAGFRVEGTNTSPAAALTLGSVNITVDDLFLLAPDFTAPDPDPLTWDIVPYTISDDKIGMTVTTATDLSGVEYQFVGYFGATIPGGGFAYNSGWVSNASHVASGLDPNQQYTFRARAQDMADVPNITGFTPNGTASTLPTDNDTPGPAEIASIVPSPISVWLTAFPATDATGSAIEYNFVPSTTNNNAVASGWQTSNEYITYGLPAETPYDWTVLVRDLAATSHTNGPSDVASTTTLAVPFSGSLTNDLKGFAAGDSTQAATLTELALAGFELASIDSEKPVFVDVTGLTFGPDQGTNGTFDNRNILRTIASDYADHDFTIEVTFAYSNQNEQVCFVGAGHGLQGEFNIPDYFITDPLVSGVMSETSAAWQKLFTWIDGTELVPVGDPEADPSTANPLVWTNGVVSLTNRVRVSYNAATTNVTYEIDYDNNGVGGAGGGFGADETLGPVTLTNVWQTAEPQRLYIAGGAGTRMYDLVITSDNFVLVPPANLAISAGGGSPLLSWTGSPGQKYDVQYKNALTDPTWIPDTGNTNIVSVGTIIKTPTAAGNKVFFNINTDYDL